MTTWKIIDQNNDRLTVKYTSDDGSRYVTMEVYWDGVSYIDTVLGQINPFPNTKIPKAVLVGREGTSPEPKLTPPVDVTIENDPMTGKPVATVTPLPPEFPP